MTPEDFNPDYLVPGTRIGAYVVRTMLGQGGSSSVYEVENAEGHRFALKMCRYHGGAYGTTEWRVDQRYSRSIICLQLLKGRRNVAELYAHDRYPDPLHGYQYLVQELVPGSLFITDWVKRGSPTLRKLVGAFVELAELCGVMASKGICHRDLKPPNILVTTDGTPKVIDFESATCPHVTPVTRGAASEVPGTGGWQSPELCLAILEEELRGKGKESFGFHPWGDLFSLGVIFYECLTGEHPFDTSLPEDMLLEEVAFETPIHPVRLSSAVPFGLNKVVMKLLEKQPEARYREGAKVADDLRRLLEKVKDKRWDKPFKQPVPDEEDAPVLPLVSALVAPKTPVPANEKESEGSMPDTPSSGPHHMDTETLRDAISSAESAESNAPSTTADTDVLLSDELETAEPRMPLDGAALDAEWDDDVPMALDFGEAGAYELEQCLGRGGMGEVYRARQVGAAGFVQWVAIKRLRPGSRRQEALSFVDEARVLSRLHHENIARVYAFHEWQGSYYLVMEYVEGYSLYALLELARRKGHRFSASVACAVMAEVAEALGYAHAATDEAGRPLQLVHRDVSPTNIVIAKTGRVVLLDFGVALSKHEGRAVTPDGSTIIKGKAPYLSPEQVKHLPLDARSDLFSMGTILAELLTGEAPFGWTADLTTLKRITAVTPEYVASLLPGVSKPLRALCQKLLAAHPEQRFATGREVALALRHCARLGEGPLGIQAEVERLHVLPGAKAPPPPAPQAAVLSLSGLKRARRVLALAGAFMLAVLVLASWYVPRHLVPVPSSPPLQGPPVSLQRPPEETIATARPVPHGPAAPLVRKPKGKDGTAVAAGPAHRRSVTAPPSGEPPDEYFAPAVVLVDKKPRIPLMMTTPPAGMGTDGAVRISPDPGGAPGTGAVRGELPVAQDQFAAVTASYVKASEEVLSPQHALAALFATGNSRLTQFVRVSNRRITVNGVSAAVAIWKPRKDADSGAVAVVVELVNPNGAPSWEPSEGRIVSDARLSLVRSAAIQAMPRVIPPGQRGRVALVFDRSIVEGQAMPIVVEILRDARPEFAMEVSSQDLEQRK